LYCAQCRCEFEGWTVKCPVCGNALVEEAPPATGAMGEAIPYDALVDLVRTNGGQLSIEMSTIEVERDRKQSFPYRGYGRAWAKRLQGSFEKIWAYLTTVEVGRDRTHRFPYQGYGFAWESEMRGTIGGTAVTLKASKVSRKMKWAFPYRGFGYAWTERLSGECGDRLQVELVTTDVGKHRERRFPYFGYGYAWANRGTLTLTLKE
jgi:hypothetical protein